MFNRCKHEWEEVARYFNAPPNGLDEIEGCGEETLLQLIYGITVVELRCPHCRDLKEHRFLGRKTLTEAIEQDRKKINHAWKI